MRILFLPETLDYFNELSTTLYEKNYFGFKDNALKYVDDLLTDIKTNLPRKVKKDAPGHFEKYGKGMKYAIFRKSRGTQWYVFFNIYRKNGETVFLIRHISNNHVAAKYIE